LAGSSTQRNWSTSRSCSATEILKKAFSISTVRATFKEQNLTMISKII
jgi:hypothetical protein